MDRTVIRYEIVTIIILVSINFHMIIFGKTGYGSPGFLRVKMRIVMFQRLWQKEH